MDEIENIWEVNMKVLIGLSNDSFTNESKNKGNVIMGHGPQVHMNYNGSLILSTTENG